jgi:hypothetical protein
MAQQAEKDAKPTNADDATLERVRGEAPDGWYLWYIRLTVHNGYETRWYAKPDGATKVVLESNDPDDLLKMIHHDEKWLPEAIRMTRETLERTPPGWAFEHGVLAIQLESLINEQHRRAAEASK